MSTAATLSTAVAGGDVSWQPPMKGSFGSSFRLGEWITGPVTPLFEDWALTRLEAAMHAELRHWTEALLRVLGVLHGRGLLHRDLKPENIVLRSLGPEEDEVKILATDLGWAALDVAVIAASVKLLKAARVAQAARAS